MTRAGSMPGWVKVLLVAAAVVVLGPPALGLVAWVLAVSVALGVAALKLGALAAVIWFVVALVKAMTRSSGGIETVPHAAPRSIDEIAEELEARRRREKDALDRQLDEALQHAP